MESEKKSDPTHTAAPAAPREVALVPQPAYVLSPYEPTSYEQALRMAGTFADSKLTKARTAAQAFLVMATGRSLGVPAETALRTFHVIDDIVTLPAQIMVALCLRKSDLCEYFDCLEADAEHATYEAKRRGRPPQRETYRLAQAKMAGLVKDKSNWEKDPASMCIARAASRLARRVFPDILAGFYTADEAMEIRESRAIDGELAPILDAKVIPIADAPAKPAAPKAEAAEAPKPPPAEDSEARLARWLRTLDEARAEPAGLIKEVTSEIKDKTHPHRVAVRERLAARKAAGWAAPEAPAPAPAETGPPHDPATGEVIEREHGSDDT